ncbi:tetraspanin-9 isoform X3 [Takifugu flavidus]|nr:tetraspanin-9 isoform X3 [Takifugu flavidus]XP_056906945.1 tetraspanin-9 isoform X3 [Takifugu flavidus]XP_056906946.1 tetraspanin-9 isoform X3 [Takifugu flavidus]
MVRGCLCCLKYMMFTFNLIFWLCGCGLLGVGIWLSVSQGSFATFSPSLPALSAANMVIGIGAIVMVTGFLGCLGAIKENKCLLLSFFIVLLIILLAEVILLILVFVYSDKVRDNAKQDLKDGLALYNSETNLGLRNAWNIIQAEWKCCGVIASTDWYEALKEQVVPDRCCQEHYQNCGRNITNMFWNRGCFEKVEEWLDDNKLLLGTIGMVILVVQELPGWSFMEQNSRGRINPGILLDFNAQKTFDLKAPGHGLLLDTVPPHPQNREEVRRLTCWPDV